MESACPTRCTCRYWCSHRKLYNRCVKRTSKFMAHDETRQCNIGDRRLFHPWQADNEVASLPPRAAFDMACHCHINSTCLFPPRLYLKVCRTPGTYKGVRMRAWGKWVSEIRVPKTGQRIWLGSYDAPEKPARAYDAAQYCIHGEGGQFNFPAERRPKLPEGTVSSLSDKDIKAIAFNFASSEASEPSQSLLRDTNSLVKDEPALPDLLVATRDS